MNKKPLVILPLMILALASCQPSREKQEKKITAMENRLFAPTSTGFEKASADSLMTLYATFIEKFPKDSLTPKYLFKAAGIAMNTGDGALAIKYFDKLYAEFPGDPKAPFCLFFKGYVQENVLHDYALARASYEMFLKKYPTNEFADDAQAAIENLGKSPDQMVKEFEAKRKADSISAAAKH
jgi:outer membrane protein assembly factor BamD (BamD/ComL family)